ncbi:thiol peroxidase [Vagococcus vulneris]|uniref:Lipid hydroperoxide peroxidase n=1 Tax=Vagococcus vulneris TaxID=1977869 RepID=A0A429ZW95_9ENTE|nr:thiol peroxidase [Vagococcus vulneris]RST98069.1 lipid hydroperoxide peroxidase [Vagococcus vulneris]
MEIKLKGETVLLEGNQPKVGDQAPDFSLKDLGDNNVSLSNLSDKPVLISVVPDIDTSICQIQTKRFNQEAAKLTGVHFLTISNNTKEQQADWCGAEGVTMTMLRDSDLDFAKKYGVYIPKIDKLARAIFIVDVSGKIAYEEIVSEVASEPDFKSALSVLN